MSRPPIFFGRSPQSARARSIRIAFWDICFGPRSISTAGAWARCSGKRFLLSTHTGRRTAVRHQTVLEVMEYKEAGPEAVVMSGFGRNSDWLRNIETSPNEEVVIGSRRFQASHRFLAKEEAVNVVGNYERRNRLVASLVRWVLSWLLGWQYRGSTDDRRRLVGNFP
jgi:deazaflavin-dependent oxidoreductase (nitroreductase family)